MSVREDIKVILAQENWTLADVAREMTKSPEKIIPVQTFHKK